MRLKWLFVGVRSLDEPVAEIAVLVAVVVELHLQALARRGVPIWPCRASVPPLKVTNPLLNGVVELRGRNGPTARMPALTVVPPVYVLAPRDRERSGAALSSGFRPRAAFGQHAGKRRTDVVGVADGKRDCRSE